MTRRRAPVRCAAGFSIVETLIAALLMMVVTGAVFHLLSPAATAFAVQPEHTDQHQRLRVAVSALQGDLELAGAGPYGEVASSGLTDHLAAVLPYRAGGAGADPPGTFREDTVTLVYVPAVPAQSAIRRAWPVPGGETIVDLRPGCGGGRQDARCGFAPGMRVMLSEPDGKWDVRIVSQVVDNGLSLVTEGPLSSTYEAAGAIATELRSRTYHVRHDVAAGTFQLMRHDGGETNLPVVDEVVRMELRYWGAAAPPQLRPGVPADPGQTTYGPPPPAIDRSSGTAWPDGENCTFIVADGAHAPRLSLLAADASGLAELTAAALTDGPWCPDAASSDRFDADLLRVRRIRVRLRVQAPARFRGPASSLFMIGGRARAPHWVPDQEIVFDVSPRNLNLAR